jgi:uncharacterized protein YkwD
VESGVVSSVRGIRQFGTPNLCATILVIGVAFVGVGNASGRPSAASVQDWTQRAPQAALGARVRHLPALEGQVLEAINGFRHEHGLVALRINRQLAATARQHSLSVAAHGYFEHTSLDGSAFWKRDRRYAGNSRIWALGENLAWGSPGLSARQALELWLASPTHRENLLSPAWREIGLGAVHAIGAGGVFNGVDATILTGDFGVRRK